MMYNYHMIFSKKLFLGESIKGKETRVIRKLKKHRMVLSTYLICMAENDSDPLEFFDSKQLTQSYYKTHDDLKVCGLASDAYEAVEVVQDIVQASVDNGYDTVRSYVEVLFL